MSPELAESIFTFYVCLFVLAGVAGYLQRKEDAQELDPAVRVLAVINITALVVVATWIFLIFSVSMPWWHFVLRYGLFGVIPALVAANYEGWPMWLWFNNVSIILSITLGIALWFLGFIAWPVWLILAIIYSRQPRVSEAS